MPSFVKGKFGRLLQNRCVTHGIGLTCGFSVERELVC